MVSRRFDRLLPKIQTVLEGQPVVRAWLFGSFSRGEESPQSDIDILVEYDENARVTLLTISRIRTRLSDAVGRSVDVVEKDCLLPFAVESAERDKIIIYERTS
ncbi:MAG: nucleotidyltransferase domain-containing protein [Bacteroidales bacterium]|nr:nucleotidyltransferase domain-containing protein [Bacteroidales bacterium]